MKKYIVTLAALALAIGGSINLTGCGGEPTGAPTAKPEPVHTPDPAKENVVDPDDGSTGTTPNPSDAKPAEKEKE